MLFMPPTPLFSSRASSRREYLTFFQAEKIAVSQQASRGLRLTQVKARMSIVEGRDAQEVSRQVWMALQM